MSAPAVVIPAQPWMRAPQTLAVMAALQAAGGPGCARYVGGCVRNALSGHAVEDIDIATTLLPRQSMAAVRAAGLKAVPTGEDHGTITAVASGQPFEITTLRRDVETDGRRAVVAFTTDWAEDAQRRDFRLNALYADAEGRVLDPTGEGVADARAGRIVFVGDAETRIAEDALRILRFFRFLAWYGQGAPDAAAMSACERFRDKIEGLSAERVSKELLKLLAAADPRPAMRLMARSGVLGLVLPEAPGLDRFEALASVEAVLSSPPDSLLRLGAFLPDEAEVAEACATRLRLSNAQRDRLVAMLGAAPRVDASMSLLQARQAIYRFGAEAFRDRLLLVWAGSVDLAAGEPWRGLLAVAEGWAPPRFSLTGEAVMAAGVAKGPKVGAVMRAVEAWWIEQDFPEDQALIAEHLAAVIGRAAS